MIYLSTPLKGADWDTMRQHRIGIMRTPQAGNTPEQLATAYCWAADNGCFSQGASFDLARYLAWLERMRPAQGNCLFAVAPDVLGDARATWERSEAVLSAIRQLGYKAALVAQNGLEDLDIGWPAFDCLFVGGDDAFKLSEAAYGLVREAKARGKWAHMGRVNSRQRLFAAAISGYDSADGTDLRFNPSERLPLWIRWLGELQQQTRFTV